MQENYSKESHKKKRCSMCRGTGKVHYPFEDSDVEDTCPVCYGKGWIQNVHGGEW